MKQYFKIGKIVNTVGLNGEVKVYPTTDLIRQFDILENVRIILINKEHITLEIEYVRYHKNLVILKLKGVDDVETAEIFKQSELIISREQSVPLQENEYYHADLIGLKVVDILNRPVGTIIDVIFVMGANDIYVVGREGKKDLLLPAIKQCIKHVDIENGFMIVLILNGLEDL